MIAARHSSRGLALPAALIMMLMISSLTLILSRMTVHNLTEISTTDSTELTFLAAEGALNKQIGDMSVLATLWETKPVLASHPASYTEYSPFSYSSTNGIPSCSGIACQRDLYPTGGGLLKNLGPVGGDGEQVDTAFSITEQLNPADLPTADMTLSSVSAWTQVERLDETTPSASNVGGSLNSGLAEGGNAKMVRFRLTSASSKDLKGRRGYTTIVAVVEMPLQ
jgi:hypothetical protein